GPVAGAAVVKAVTIPVIGGVRGGPRLHGPGRPPPTAVGHSGEGVDFQNQAHVDTPEGPRRALTAPSPRPRRGRPDQGRGAPPARPRRRAPGPAAAGGPGPPISATPRTRAVHATSVARYPKCACRAPKCRGRSPTGPGHPARPDCGVRIVEFGLWSSWTTLAQRFVNA